MVCGTRLTNTEYMNTTERIGAQTLESAFPCEQAVVLLSTIYNYTLSFVMEEQAVFPVAGERSPRYSIEGRNARLDPAVFPFHRQTSSILFDRYDRRYREGLDLILQGAGPEGTRRAAHKRPREVAGATKTLSSPRQILTKTS